MNTIVNRRLGIISEITRTKQGLGKTAMVKYLYLLQEVYNVPLQYNFEIYTYGPYTSEVMGDIDLATHFGAISTEVCHYTNTYGYSLNPSVNIDNYINKEKSFLNKQKKSINDIIAKFGQKTAKELELITTIIYLYKSYINNNWDASIKEISRNVHEIKPHFDISSIQREYRELDEKGILEMSVK